MRDPGKTITFADGFSISVNTLLNLAGENGSPLTLRASEGVTPWALKLASGAEQSVGFVSVSDSDASAGEEIVAINSTGSNTQNWRFVSAQPGDVLTWTGASSSGWALPANWDAGRAPIPTDVIVIPGGRPHNPVLASPVIVAQLTVEQGASLNLDGNDLAVTGNLAVNGRLAATATETIAVSGNCSLVPGGFTAASSTLRLDGTSAQTAALGGNRLYRLVLANSSPDGIAFTQDFTTGSLVCAPTGATALRFASGVTASVSVSLTLVGASAESPLTLAPQTAGGWNLHSLGIAEISHCAVSDSTATGNALLATDSTDNGGNVNWSFGAASTRTWTGTVSADFSDAGNWAEGSVPGTGDTVVFDSARPMTISAPATIRSLVVGGSGAPTLTVNAPLSVSDAVVAKADATIVANRKVTVGGSLITEAGATITHAANSSSATANHIDLEVGGDLILPVGASISATGKGYAGDNTSNGGPGYQSNSGGSHGGRGGSHNNNGQRACYGSIYCPTNFGSARNGGIVGGGGAVRLVVSGEISLNGTVDADGGENDGVATASVFYGSSGGSVWITANHLSGTGKISASGGAIKDNYLGAGGRVAIYLTGDRALSFGGSVEAYAGCKSVDVPPYPKGAPGTIYVETASDAARRGRVIVANAPNGVSNGGQNSKPLVDYPVTKWCERDDGRWATWELSNYATLNVTADAKIADVWLNGSNPQIQLNGHTLRIGTRQHALGKSASQVVAGGTAENPGQIIWQEPATILFLK